MTRETKIGLLVGLAFIIVIGILLSDHLTSTTEPPQAPLVQAGKDVRSAVAVPGGASAPVTQVQIPQITPAAPVPTREELQPKQPPVAIVQIGPAGGQQPQPAPPAPANQNGTPVAVNTNPAPTGNTAVDSNSVPAPRNTEVATNNSTGNSTLENVANSMNEPIVPAGTPTSTNGNDTAPQQPTPLAVPVAQGKQYKAAPGDNLSKIAARFYGTGSRANQELIVNANPTLKANRDMIIVGKTYIIPAAQTAQAPAASPVTQNPATPKLAPQVVVVDDTAKPQAPNSQASSGEHYYVVKPNETLIRIAREQLGNADAWHAIAELNKIQDAGKIYVGMKLRLPAKPVSVAQSN